MRIEATVTVIYVDGRVLVRAEIDGCPTNMVDVIATDEDEVNLAIGMVTRSVRRQFVFEVMKSTL